ncbi:uncharacterized protein LOC127283926 isoform X2 [Leptopilina boulardi]|uniref:uncharacterized protein LOC127283926 isoform X2 n=1 Tax=Leptopilina boulardi TaxID=63433 RepID=UPI0021F553F4|nr:uncharacterized protein LOC127283926 isoform X2 [Leptopilina boulardi]
MDILENPHYIFAKYIIIVSGQSQYHPKWLKFLIKFTIFITLFSCQCGLYAGMMKAFGNIDSMLETIPPICYGLISITILINNNLQEQQMKLIFSKIESDWKTLTSKHEIDVLHKYGKKSKFFNTVYMVGFFGHCTIYLFSNSLLVIIGFFQNSNEHRPILFPFYFGIDTEKYYHLILLYSHVCAYFGTILNANGAMIFSILIEHACGIFEIIGHKLTTSIMKSGDYSSKQSFKRNLQQEIILCVKMHKKVLLFVNDIEKLFSTAYLLIFGLCIIDLSVTGVQSVMYIHNVKEAARFGFYAVAQVFHIFLLTLPTQHLMDKSLCISDCIYNANWYHLSSENQKLLLIIMRKGAEPAKFVVGRIFTLSLQFFTKVLQTSMSYFTVLMAVRR